MNLYRSLLLVASIAASVRANAASHPYFEFAQRFLPGQSNVRIYLERTDGPLVYTGVLLRNEPEAVLVWSPDFRTRLSIPQLRWPLLESVGQHDGFKVGDEATCDLGTGTASRRGLIATIDRNPMRAVFGMSAGERGRVFFSRCSR
jgi:hypothetical protein